INVSDPRRILHMTVSLHAEAEMIRRVERITRQIMGSSTDVMTEALTWAGMLHGIGARLLREYADQIGVDPAFTIHDREDSADLVNLVRNELGFSRSANRFPTKGTCDRPRSPRRGPARVAQCPHERRSGARGEALWAPVGDQCTGAHAAELSLVTRRRRSDGPLRSMRWARWMMRSRMASAKVGSPMTSCQRLIGIWLVTSRDPLS